MNFWHRLGLGLGGMELMLPQKSVAMGQVLRGEMMFHLTEEVLANAVHVGLWAYQRVDRPTLVTDHSDFYKSQVVTRRETVTSTLFHARTRLDGERTYRSGFYAFEARLPCAIKPTEPDDFQKLLEVAATFKHGIATSRGPVVWELYGELEIPRSVSLKANVTLQVHPALPGGPSYSGAPGVSALDIDLCPGCGGPLSAVYGCAGCPESEDSPPPPARFCTECGEPRYRSARYCGNCGTRMES